MTKFKVGDKVRVRKDLKVDQAYEGCVFLSSMAALEGKNVTIANVFNDGSYEIKESGYYWTDEMFISTQITIDDLQFADILTLRNGERYVYASGYMYEENKDCYCDCDAVEDCYGNDLKRKSNNEYDIMKVERQGQIVFERKDVREMTVEEISKALGYEVKVVK